MRVTGDTNPSKMEFNDIKIGEMVPIQMSAFHWVEAASEIHAVFRLHQEEPPVVVQWLIGKVFEALTPESYRKALAAEYHEVQEHAANANPLMAMFGGRLPTFLNPEDFEGEGDADNT